MNTTQSPTIAQLSRQYRTVHLFRLFERNMNQRYAQSHQENKTILLRESIQDWKKHAPLTDWLDGQLLDWPYQSFSDIFYILLRQPPAGGRIELCFCSFYHSLQALLHFDQQQRQVTWIYYAFTPMAGMTDRLLDQLVTWCLQYQCDTLQVMAVSQELDLTLVRYRMQPYGIRVQAIARD